MRAGLSETADRVLRGGSWANQARNLHAAIRNRNRAGNRNQNIGFRVVVRFRPEHAFHADRSRAGEIQDRPVQSPDRPKRHCPAVPVSHLAHRPAGHLRGGQSAR